MTANEILSLYEELQSVKATARKAECSPQVVRRLLITHGIYPTERCKEIARMLTLNYTVDEIATTLKITPKAVGNHLPYTKGSYTVGTKSENAQRIAKCRSNKTSPFNSSIDKL